MAQSAISELDLSPNKERARVPVRLTARSLFVLGVIIWLAVHASCLRSVLRQRDMPVSPDDAYTYISSAAQMEQAFLQDCPALNDLRHQLRAPSTNSEIHWQRYRAYTRNFVVLNPLHSAMLVGLRRLGWDWETAYNVVVVAGALSLGLAFAYLLYCLWGPAPAGIGMLLLVMIPTIFDQGLGYIGPWHLALCVAMIIWGRLIIKQGSAPFSVVAGSLLMMALHPIGRIYTCMAVMLSFVLLVQTRLKSAILLNVLPAVLVAAAFIMPHLIERPELTFTQDPLPGGSSAFTGVEASLRVAKDSIHDWGRRYGWSFVLPAVAVGILATPGADRKTVYRFLFVLGVFCLIGFFYVLPRYPGLMFIRIWPVIAVVLTGAMGSAVAFAIPSLRRQIQVTPMPDEFKNEPGLTFRAAPWVVRLVLIGVLLQIPYQEFRTAKASAANRDNIALDEAQVRRLLALAGPQDKVLYDEETVMGFYLSHGALQHGAVFYPALAGSPEQAQWLEHPDLRFAVARSPLGRCCQTTVHTYGYRNMEVRLPGTSAQTWINLSVSNAGPDAQIETTALTVKGDQNLGAIATTIPAGYNGVIAVDVSHLGPCQGYRIGLPHATFFQVHGITFDEDTLNWPWHQQATVRFVARDGGADLELKFEASQHIKLPQREAAWRLEVIDDRGSSVLFQIL